MTLDVRHPQAPTTPPASAGRRADIQGLRAIAVLLVVAFHAKLPVPGGFVGVDVFFVISGFVITAMLMRQWAAAGRLSLPTFYFRRFLRLTPALALLVTVVAIVSILLQNPFGAQQTTARTGIGAMLLSANAVIAHTADDYFADSSTTNPLLNTWSLSVEEQFYLVFPAVLVLGWLLARRLQWRLGPPVVLIALITAGSFVLSVALSNGSPLAQGAADFFGGAQSFAFYSPFTRAWEFGAGALLALVLERLRAPSRGISWIVGATGAAVIAVAALAIHDSMVFPGLLALLPVVGTVLMIYAGSHHTTGVSAALATRPMVLVGDISYSWYLWHWPVIVFAALLFPGQRTILLLAAVASLIPALVSYRFVEQPLRIWLPSTRPRSTALVATTLAIPLAACLVLLTGANAGWGLTTPTALAISAVTVGGSQATEPGTAAKPTPPIADDPAAQQAAVDDGEAAGGEGGSLRSQHAVVKAGCVNGRVDPRRCRFGPEDAAGTVLLVGDSQAYALADGVIAAAGQLGYDTIATSHNGCPFLGRESSGVHDYPCRAWQKSIVAYAVSSRPATVIIANRSAGYVHPEWGWRTAERDDGGRADSVDEAAALWQKGLEPVVGALRDAGIGVIILGAVPQMHGYTDRTSILGRAFGTRDFTVSREDSVNDRQPALAAEQAVAANHPGTIVHDLLPAMCDDSTCWATRDGTALYQDETHVSVAGSMLLVDGLRDAISQSVGGSAQ